eukprot:symbB.v1.2.007966.t1/scaffold465.1/size200768/2
MSSIAHVATKAKPSVANPNASARHLSLSPGAQHRVVRTAVEKTPRSRGSVTARTLSPAPATTPSTPLVQMRVPVSATSPQTPRMQSPVQLASGVSQPCRTSTFLSDVQVRTDWHSRPVSTMRCEAGLGSRCHALYDSTINSNEGMLGLGGPTNITSFGPQWKG